MVSLTLRLEDDVHEALRKEAFEQRKTITGIIKQRIKDGTRKEIDVRNLGKPNHLRPAGGVENGFAFEEPANSARLSNGICKVHALPLDARGRCLQKGCKYV